MGLYLGTSIGDALGMPAEGWTPDRISETFGRMDRYHEPKGHKYFVGKRAGSWTDDTHLSLAVSQGLTQCPPGSHHASLMDAIAKAHVEALDEDVGGYGRSTREAVARLKAGFHWSISGLSPDDISKPISGPGGRRSNGYGNGVAMKMGPVGAWLWVTRHDCGVATTDQIADVAMMTHPTSMGVSSGLAHAYAVLYCLLATPRTFSANDFISTVVETSRWGREYKKSTQSGDDLTDRLAELAGYESFAPEVIAEKFGGGSFYVYDSLPFTYAYLLRNYQTIESLYDIAGAGGDTDSNASMLGGLLGAIHGASFFPKHLVDGLVDRERIETAARQFCSVFALEQNPVLKWC